MLGLVGSLFDVARDGAEMIEHELHYRHVCVDRRMDGIAFAVANDVVSIDDGLDA